jgi:hypothetical protein
LIESAKCAASIPAVLAHAGRVEAPPGRDPVDFWCAGFWDLLRAELPEAGGFAGALAAAAAPDRVSVLRAMHPLWPAGAPPWSQRIR